MESILGSNGSLSGFFAFLSPLFNLVFTALSVRVFGIQLWLILLNCLVCFTIIGFITKGSVGIGSGLSKAVSASSSRKARKNGDQ